MRSSLPQGLPVLVAPGAPSPVVSVGLHVRFGSAHEREGEHGLAHLLEHVVVRSRLTGHGVVDAVTSRECTSYRALVPREETYAAVRSLCRVFGGGRAGTRLLADELDVIGQERAERRNTPSWVLRERLFSRLWAGTPYAHDIIGHPETITDLSPATLDRMCRSHYTPENALLVIVGGSGPDGPAPVVEPPECFVAGPVRAELEVGQRRAYGVAWHEPTGSFSAAARTLAVRVAQRSGILQAQQLAVRGGWVTWLTKVGSPDLFAAVRDLLERVDPAQLTAALIEELRTVHHEERRGARLARPWRAGVTEPDAGSLREVGVDELVAVLRWWGAQVRGVAS